MKTLVATLLLSSGSVLAHPGHGAPDIHSHPWDAALVGAGIVLVLALAWFLSGKK